MLLYLLRHANADTNAARDDQRCLSTKGIDQAKRVARSCDAHAIEPEIILASPVLRAQQTAEIVADHLRVEKVTVPWAACGMNPHTATEELRGFSKFEQIMLVGHEPDFSVLVAHLIGLADSQQIRIRKASLTLLDVAAFRAGGACLEFTMLCRLM